MTPDAARDPDPPTASSDPNAPDNPDGPRAPAGPSDPDARCDPDAPDALCDPDAPGDPAARSDPTARTSPSAPGGRQARSGPDARTRLGELHHVELWVPDVIAAESAWAPVLLALGYRQHQRWERGVSFRLAGTYLVLEQSPALSAATHERTRPGLNHLAFWAGTEADVDELATLAQRSGWSLLFADRHPYAGGRAHYAAFLEDGAGFEIELVAGS